MTAGEGDEAAIEGKLRAVGQRSQVVVCERETLSHEAQEFAAKDAYHRR